jgi:hypothetical protein
MKHTKDSDVDKDKAKIHLQWSWEDSEQIRKARIKSYWKGCLDYCLGTFAPLAVGAFGIALVVLIVAAPIAWSASVTNSAVLETVAERLATKGFALALVGVVAGLLFALGACVILMKRNKELED